MVIGTSALLAILLKEPEADAMIDALERDQRRMLSAVQLLEAAVVIEAKKGPAGGRELDFAVTSGAGACGELHRGVGGSGSGGVAAVGEGKSSAGLDYGACCAYALAQQLGEPLLFKGDDFRKTDLSAAV